MRVTIVVADGFVSVNGRGFDKLDLAGLPANVHAVQWYGQVGEVEYAVDGLGVKPPNAAIDTLAPFQPAIDAWTAARDAADAPPPPPTPEQLVQRFTMEIQARLDAFAKTRNYDSMLSACTYATSTVPKFAAEGQYCVEARDATWAAAYLILEQVQAGSRPMPDSVADIESDLPALEWPVT